MSEPTAPCHKGEILTGEIAQRISQETTVHLNLAQEMIVITEDKVRLCLTSHLKRIEARRGWVAPAAILVSILLTLVTAEFHDLYFKAPLWQAIFIWALVLDAIWLISAVLSALNSSSVDDVVAEMKRAGTLRTNGHAEPAVSAVAVSRPGWKVVGNWEMQENEVGNWESGGDWINGKNAGTVLWQERLPDRWRINFQARVVENLGSDEIDVIVGDSMVLYYSGGFRLDYMNDDLGRERNKKMVPWQKPQLQQWYEFTVEKTKGDCTLKIGGKLVMSMPSDLGRTGFRGRIGFAHWHNRVEFRGLGIEKLP